MPEYSCEEVPVDDVLVSACQAVYDLWRSSSSVADQPMWRDIDLSAFPSDIIPFLRVVDVVDDGTSFRYRFWGTGMTDIYGVEQTGRRMHVSAYLPPDSGCLVECRRVKAEGRPMGYKRRVSVGHGKLNSQSLELLGIRLPLVSVSGDVAHILSFSDYGDRRSDWKRAMQDLSAPNPQPN